MKKRTALLAALVLAAANVFAADLSIKEIRIRNEGAGRIDRAFVLAHTSAEAGSELSHTQVASDVRALLDTGRFSHVSVEAEPVEDGVALTFVVRKRLRLVQPVRVTGAQSMRQSKVRDLLGLRVGDLVDDQVFGVRARKVEEVYREKDRAKADVSWLIRVVDHEEGTATAELTIDEGAKVKAASVVFRGNDSLGAGALRKAVRQPAWWNPMRWFGARRYDEHELELARLAVRDVYRDRGYLDAEVDVPAVEQDADGRAALTFTVREGPLYRCGDVALVGVETFPEADLARLVMLSEGDVASSSVIRQTTRALRDYYGSRGYVNTTVRPQLDANAETGLTGIRFLVDEGELVHVGNVRIQGNTRTRDKVVRRELLVYPGDIFDEVRVERSRRRIQNLGYFSTVRTRPESTRDPNERDLVVEVEEKRTGQFMMGAGFSSVDKIVGFAEVSQGNFDLRGWPYFTGAGQKLKLRGQFGSTRNEYELSFVEPWFLNRKLSFGFDLYRTDVDYTDFDIERTGGAISLTKALPGANRINARYKLERLNISDVADTNEYVFVDAPDQSYYFRSEEDTVESTLTLTLTHDTRDNPFVPTRGDRVSLFGSLSGGPLGFDTEIYGLGLRGKRYVPLWWKHVLSLRYRYEIVDEYGDTDLMPIGNRLFLGGGRTLRGFEYRDVGPKVQRSDLAEGSSSYRPVGGRSLVVGGAEYAVPIVTNLRLATFYDTGNVWWDSFDLDLDDLASSWGVGVRLDIPGFPIRVDRAWVIEKDDELTEKDSWTIWIGYDY